jgi:hypothetical protein
VTDRGAVLDQLSKIAKALNALDANLTHGNVLAARETSAVMRAELVTLTEIMGFRT